MLKYHRCFLCLVSSFCATGTAFLAIAFIVEGADILVAPTMEKMHVMFIVAARGVAMGCQP